MFQTKKVSCKFLNDYIFKYNNLKSSKIKDKGKNVNSKVIKASNVLQKFNILYVLLEPILLPYLLGIESIFFSNSFFSYFILGFDQMCVKHLHGATAYFLC
jgi:hypothetical protein